MKNFFLLFLLAAFSGSSQSKQLWKGYFSYREIKDLSEAPAKITAASENALFAKDVINGSIKTTNTIDGLSGLTISAIYHSEAFKKTLVGYENGLMIVINEVDGSMFNVVDIINKTLPPNIKKVNHFMEYNGIAYVSCDFGIVAYNLTTLEFGSTFFIGNNGAQIAVKQTAVFQNRIYAATLSNGIRSADITNPNLNDFNQWTTMNTEGYVGIEAFSDRLFAVTNGGNLQRLQGTTFVSQQQYPQTAVVDMRKNGSNLIVTTANHVYLYNSDAIQIRDLNSSETGIAGIVFTCATIVNNMIYIGTFENGLYSTALMDASFEDMTPGGPVRNNIFAITATKSALWAVYGGYDVSYNPNAYYGNTPAQFSISKYKQGNWLEIPYGDILGAKALVRITPNPNNENQVFVSSFDSGLLKIENDVPVILYNQNNTGSTGLEAFPSSTTVRVDGTVFDQAGNLWVTNSLSADALKVFKTNGQWSEYNMNGLYNNVGKFNLGRMTIDKNGTKWMTTRDEGVIAFNESYGNLFKTIKATPDTGNLPNINSRVVAVDHRNQLWIGTNNGLRVLPSVDSFMASAQMIAEPIIIIEDDLAQELLYEQFIRDIVVDGANNKWIGTLDAGVFLVSPNGQQTIYHFDTSNSPLPSNVINDIDINGTTGEVFFATDKGMVSFKGIATDASADLNNVYVYPNPVRPEFSGTVKVSGLLDKANVKIADIEGNLVYETISEGGTIEWDTTAFGKYKVASGVYVIFISAEDGSETKVKKVMIVR